MAIGNHHQVEFRRQRVERNHVFDQEFATGPFDTGQCEVRVPNRPAETREVPRTRENLLSVEFFDHHTTGDGIVSGMYIYRYISSEKAITRKMLYLK